MNLDSLKSIIENEVEAITQELIDIRRHLHQYPELGRQERKTSAFLLEKMKTFNLNINTHDGETGFWADLVTVPGHKFIALRSDIDALPIEENTDVTYASKNKGVMHACGHDVHSTVLLGTAMLLSKLQNIFKVNVRFIFQPAEEVTPGGALDMIRRRAVENVEAILALHVTPVLPVGFIGIKFGPFLASNDIFKIKITGKGGHAAHPHETIDPLLITSQLMNALYQLNHNVNPIKSAVLSISRVHGGTAVNVIPDETEIWGTFRAFDPATRKFLGKRLDQIVGRVCHLHDAKFDLSVTNGAPSLINDTALCKFLVDSSAELLGKEKIIKIAEPEMGSEDFAWYLQHVPGVMFGLGTKGRDGTDYALHHPNFDVDEKAIAVGVKVFCWTVIRYFANKDLAKL